MRKSAAGNRGRDPEVSSKWIIHGWGKRLERTIIKRVTDSKTFKNVWTDGQGKRIKRTAISRLLVTGGTRETRASHKENTDRRSTTPQHSGERLDLFL